ncbi:PQQ-dependent dehydrogenase, methanol/ethanol family [Methylobacterium sp. J-068]|uniref:PQQ-dependent dehydrogenase, methanol/ethanol family n=1 Tax=Methylobacterium sp. J-068 TaxID=2836649 RepID=UPI001FBBC68A|nr:PQQ-dependent dehydrogenase, methanol/ethanol family [Methylobacterium sp. J-068]MCJ2033968.1 PQQ-dependent dehydrogenase, methanol/ethanol family [Methylobacterium sp. J-068]
MAVALTAAPFGSFALAQTAPSQIGKAVATLDENFIRANAKTSKDWPAVGQDLGETRFSKLDQINTTSIKKLGLAWSYDLESTRGVEATPLVVDGVMYVSASWSIVHAIDARTGKRLWTFDPEVPRDIGYKGCCDVVNRGVALYKGKLFVGAFDGRLIALDAATGRKLWETDTIIDHSHSYTSTGAPRVVNGKVVIGNGGAEYGVRGYVTAYDAETGNQAWRWFVVPGDPSKPFEDASMEAAAKTWDPAGKYWVNGGGGSAWDTITYDPDLKTVYIGTGNGSPWNQNVRSPAGGDNLYLGSVVALDADTGQYKWHYQETPGDNWDYTSTQPMILTDIKIDGAMRKVILHAPKNGFFFVIDRTNGKLISAKNFVDVNWATGYDANGRPIEIPGARSVTKPVDAVPGPYGAHSWHPMSYNPMTGLVYLPAQHVPLNLMNQPTWYQNDRKPGEFGTNTGWNIGFSLNVVPPKSQPFGRLIAWDPVAQKEVWHQEHVSPWNGGTLTTAGNLVFQGTADARFVAYNATTGEKLWESPTGTGVMAAASTYMLDGVQYVSVAVGWGGAYGISSRVADRNAQGTVYTFAIDGKAKLPAFAEYRMESLLSGVKYDPAEVEPGRQIYFSSCLACHGVPGLGKGGNVPNLGFIGSHNIENLKSIIYDGPYKQLGMPDFTGKIAESDVSKLIAYIQGTADSVRPKK